MPNKNKNEWDDISNGKVFVYIGFFDKDDNICEVNKVNVDKVNEFVNITSNKDMDKFCNEILK